jgi:hypothetical protein
MVSRQSFNFDNYCPPRPVFCPPPQQSIDVPCLPQYSNAPIPSPNCPPPPLTINMPHMPGPECPPESFYDCPPRPPQVNYQPCPPLRSGTEEGRVWGDPHVEGFDGEKFDFNGQAGRTYSVINDRGLSLNTRMQSWGNGPATTMGEVGVTVGNNRIYWDAEAPGPLLNGNAMAQNSTYNLGGQQSVAYSGNQLSFNTREYNFKLQDNGDYLDLNNVQLKGDAYAGGILGSTAAEGKQFEGWSKGQIEDFGARNWATPGLF